MTASAKQAIPLGQADALAQQIVDLLQNSCSHLRIAGSIRREKPMVSDLEIVAQPNNVTLTRADELLAEGVFTKRHAWGDRAKFGMYKGIPFDLFVSLADRQFACTYWLRTGSAEANTLMVTQWHKGGILPDTISFCAEQFWVLPQPIYELDAQEFERCKKKSDLTPLGGEIILTPNEEDIFALADLPFIPPQFRDERTYRMLAGRRLVSVHDVAHLWDERVARWAIPELVYIGRAMPHINLPRSRWANPFRITYDSPEARASAITQYRTHIHKFIADKKVNLDELRGKTLVCWCADHDNPKPCHGDVLLELLGQYTPSENAPKQMQLFGGAAMREMEHNAAVRQETETKPKRYERHEEAFEWRLPWLDASGQVWVHIGYGDYALHEPTSQRARLHLGYLQGLDYAGLRAARWRLEAFLHAREHPSREPFQKPALAPTVMALTLYQPWATLIMIGAKRIETPSWKPYHIGRLVIHAGQEWTRKEQAYANTPIVRQALARAGFTPNALPLGAALGETFLTGYETTETLVNRIGDEERFFGDYGPNRFGWFLENPQAFPEPILCNGHQKLWKWEAA